MDRVDKTITSRQLAGLARDTCITQQTGRHAWPQRKDDEGEQVADSECSSASSVQPRTRGRSIQLVIPWVPVWIIQRVARGGVVIQPDQEGNGARNMDERVRPVGPGHQLRMAQQELLEINFPEQA